MFGFVTNIFNFIFGFVTNILYFHFGSVTNIFNFMFGFITNMYYICSLNNIKNNVLQKNNITIAFLG